MPLPICFSNQQNNHQCSSLLVCLSGHRLQCCSLWLSWPSCSGLVISSHSLAHMTTFKLHHIHTSHFTVVHCWLPSVYYNTYFIKWLQVLLSSKEKEMLFVPLNKTSEISCLVSFYLLWILWIIVDTDGSGYLLYDIKQWSFTPRTWFL